MEWRLKFYVNVIIQRRVMSCYVDRNVARVEVQRSLVCLSVVVRYRTVCTTVLSGI